MIRTSKFILLIFSLVVIVFISACTENAIEPYDNEVVPQQPNRNNIINQDRKGDEVKSEGKGSIEIVEQEKKAESYSDGHNKSNQELKTKRLESERVKVKGIYVSGWIAGSHDKMNNLIEQVKKTELNAMIIDIKNDNGEITYDSNVPLANKLGSDHRKMVADIRPLIQKLKDQNIYTVARIVAFKDPLLAAKHPELAMHYHSGKVWKDSKGIAWVDPYQMKVRDYNLAIAEEATEIGFDEIQFDYVRFPENGKKLDQDVVFKNSEGISKSQLIANFLSTATKQLHEQDVFVSADVFGLTTSTSDDMGIGQDWNLVSSSVDYISPMVYPSHYSNGVYGLSHPDLKPYEVVKHAMKDGRLKNEQLKKEQKLSAIIRPWFQCFTATWVHPHISYTHAEVDLQIKAAREQGVEEYMLWNPHCKYLLE